MKKAFFIILLTSLLSGCALTTEQIDLSYIPQPGVIKIVEAGNIIVSVQINDQRQDKSKTVSRKKNGFGMEMAPILVNEDVTVTIRHAIEQELQSRGFLISNEPVVSIFADLNRFWNDHKVGFFTGDAVADLNMSISIKDKNGNVHYSRNIVVQGIESNTLLFGGDNARLALNKALENGLKLLFEDEKFISALLRGPMKSSSITVK